MHVAQKWPRFWGNDMHESKNLGATIAAPYRR